MCVCARVIEPLAKGENKIDQTSAADSALICWSTEKDQESEPHHSDLCTTLPACQKTF